MILSVFSKKLQIIAIFFIIISLCSCHNDKVKNTPAKATGNFEFVVLKAGQADAIIAKTQNNCIIIDCGETDDGDEVVEYLANNSINNVDCLIITHFDKDHVGGFPEVANNVSVSNIYVPDYKGNNDEYEMYLKTVQENNLNITTLTEDTNFTFDDVYLDVSVPKRKSYTEGDNDFSLVVSAMHGQNSFLFAADAESERLSEVLLEFGTQYDFLKVPHHGKHNSNSKRFINTIKPDYAVITDSDKNPANKKITSYLQSNGTKIYSTRNGTVNVFSDGLKLNIVQ